MADATRILDQLFGSAPGGGGVVDRVQGFARQNPMLAGGIAGGLAGLILGRGGLGSLVKYGGLAALGGLAYKAYRDSQQTQTAPAGGAGVGDLLPPPAGSPFAPASAPAARGRLAEAMIEAMVGAAKADGRIDAEERGRIYEKLEQGGLDAEELTFLRRAIDEPLNLERIAAGVAGKEEALEVYAAALMAIRNDSAAERDYLAALAGRLGIDQGLAEAVEKTVTEATAASP